MGIGKCECGRCIRMSEAKKIIESGSDERKKQLIIDLLDNLANTEMESEHAEMILDGTWPNAVDILERSLVKARQIAFERSI